MMMIFIIKIGVLHQINTINSSNKQLHCFHFDVFTASLFDNKSFLSLAYIYKSLLYSKLCDLIDFYLANVEIWKLHFMNNILKTKLYAFGYIEIILFMGN